MSMLTFWLIAAMVAMAIELISGTVIALCLGVGALAAAVPAAFDVPLAWQIACFVVCTVLAFIFLRPAVKRLYATKHRHQYASNMDALIGRYGKVTADVTNNFDDKGRVQIDGDNWLAYTTSPEWPIKRGDQVIVEAYESLVLRVRPLKGEN